MGIPVEIYRTRIGHFEANEIRNMKRNKFRVKCGKTKKSVAFVLSIIILQLFSSCYQPRNESFKTTSPAQYSKSLPGPYCSINAIIRVSENCLEENLLYHWAQSGLSINKFQKMINGNRRSVGYKLAVWNCGRGLVQEGFSVKFHEVKQFLETKHPHCFGIIESDLHSHQSQTNRVKYSTAELREYLKVDGYNLGHAWTSQNYLLCITRN